MSTASRSTKVKAGDGKGFGHLLSPIKIGGLEIKNRIALSPMNETFSDGEGRAGEQCIAYFAARARGGTGLLVTGAVMGTRTAAKFVWGRNLYCFNEGHLQSLVLLTERVHYFGGKIAAQMTIGFGRQGHSYDHEELVPAPTAGLPYEFGLDAQPRFIAGGMRRNERARSFGYGQMTREMSIEEIHHDQREFANSCQLAVLAGFDVIEVHAPHGYLEHQFLSPLSNKRTDMYGGEWHNRKRFINEAMEQVRYAVPNTPVGVRISAEEHFEGGLTREEMIDVALGLEARGADYVSLSDGGGYEEAGHLVGEEDRVEHIPDSAVDFKKALKVPVIVASQHDPIKADADIAAGKYDISGLGRQLFVDPDYATKLAEGRAEEIVRCTRCNTCLARCLAGIGPACPNNPWLGREYADQGLMIGPRRKGEKLLPPGGPMPAVYGRPWWKPEITIDEEHFRPFRGPGPR
ncbi:MAG: NADH:flavin oxidoreductase [Thermoleophilia bacterium]|nr:NADH:flavin oxidoreductase [Thermoleophilia bacterium]